MLVHGAGSGPWVFDHWDDDFGAYDVLAVDLQEDLDPAEASMGDYAARVVSVATARRPLVVCGWSMGGLVALLAARDVAPDALVLIEPSPPAEAQDNVDVPLARGTFDPEEAYGAFPAGAAPRPESSLARAERKRGISVPSIACRCLVVSGDEFADERGTRVARLYGADHRHFPGLSHWDLVRSPVVRDAVAEWLA